MRQLNESPTLGVSEGFAPETELQLQLLGGDNQLEAVRPNFTKTPPRVHDPE